MEQIVTVNRDSRSPCNPPHHPVRWLLNSPRVSSGLSNKHQAPAPLQSCLVSSWPRDPRNRGQIPGGSRILLSGHYPVELGASPQGFAGDLDGNTQPVKPWAPADAVYCRTRLQHRHCHLLSLQSFPSSPRHLKPQVGASSTLLQGQWGKSVFCLPLKCPSWPPPTLPPASFQWSLANTWGR